LYDIAAGTWGATASLSGPRDGPTATLLGNGNVLIAGGYYSLPPYSSCELYDVSPTAEGQTVTVHSGAPGTITLAALSLTQPVTFTVVGNPAKGTLTGTAPNLTYTSNVGYVGSDSFTFKANDGYNDSNIASVTINVTDTAPAVTAGASPTGVVPDGAVVFSASGSDPDGDALTYSWTFGDGGTSTEQNPTHAYAAVGVYTATVTVTDPAGATGSASVTIQVSKAPTVRVTTSDVVAFAGNSFTFDASPSTDPENAIASYTWNFGDGTPPGSGQVISKVYDNPGEYTVTLTVTDAAGVSSTLTRVIQVLPEDEMGLFNGYVTYQAKWDRNKENKDTLSLTANVNVGDYVVAAGAPVALEIAGQRFTGTLDKKLRDYTNKDVDRKSVV
jgi:PKD repeat protein